MLSGTKEALSHLLANHIPTFLTNSRTDDYVVKSLMENFRKIISIFVTKPKFHALIITEDAKPLINWLAEIVIPMLQAGALRSGVPKPNRIEFLKSIRGLLGMDINNSC